MLDPFGGIALGAYHALQRGLVWVGVELEQKFVDLGRQNIALWNDRYKGKLPKWGEATLLQGDSRELVRILREAGGLVSSPPYAQNLSSESHGVDWTKAKKDYPGRQMHAKWTARLNRHHGERQYSDDPANLGNLPIGDVNTVVSSPPYASGLGKVSTYRDRDKLEKEIHRTLVVKKAAGSYYGVTPGQLGNLPAGDVDGVVSSPPYAASLASDDPEKRGGLFRDEKRKTDKTLTATYGESEGQLAALPSSNENWTPPPGEQPSAAVSSPPFSPDQPCASQTREIKDYHSFTRGDGTKRHHGMQAPGNLDAMPQGETFWSAARLIVSQTYQVLTPGSHAVWVVKRYVRDKKIVEFSQQWAQLCQSVGFELVHWHRAWLIEHKGAQYTLDGGLERKTVKRYSFFRRLHSAKYPELEIAWEDVLCFCKPL